MKKKLTGGSCVFCRLGFTVLSGCPHFILFGQSTQKRTLAGTCVPILCFCILQGNWNAPLQSELGVSLYIFLLSGTQIVSQGIRSLFFQHLCLIPQIDYHVSLRFSHSVVRARKRGREQAEGKIILHSRQRNVGSEVSKLLKTLGCEISFVFQHKTSTAHGVIPEGIRP